MLDTPSYFDNIPTSIMHFHYFLLVPVFVLAAQLLYRLGRALFSPLRDVPGPFLARFTRLWYFHRVRQGHFEHDNIRLHEKYGPVVRIAPNQYSISDPSAVKTVYALASHFGKSAWYDAWRHPQGWNLFTDRDMKRHCKSRPLLFSAAVRTLTANLIPSRHTEATQQPIFYELSGAL